MVLLFACTSGDLLRIRKAPKNYSDHFLGVICLLSRMASRHQFRIDAALLCVLVCSLATPGIPLRRLSRISLFFIPATTRKGRIQHPAGDGVRANCSRSCLSGALTLAFLGRTPISAGVRSTGLWACSKKRTACCPFEPPLAEPVGYGKFLFLLDPCASSPVPTVPWEPFRLAGYVVDRICLHHAGLLFGRADP